MMAERWKVVPFGKGHDRSGFSCGAPELDDYLLRHAAQDGRRDFARVFLALPGTEAESGQRVCGFYSLSAASFRREDLPADMARKLPRYPVPAVLLGRLAVDVRQKGQGLGGFLLMDAMLRIVRADQEMAIHALVVDARDDVAAAFYLKYGFLPFPGNERRLFLPLATIRKLLQ